MCKNLWLQGTVSSVYMYIFYRRTVYSWKRSCHSTHNLLNNIKRTKNEFSWSFQTFFFTFFAIFTSTNDHISIFWPFFGRSNISWNYVNNNRRFLLATFLLAIQFSEESLVCRKLNKTLINKSRVNFFNTSVALELSAHKILFVV